MLSPKSTFTARAPASVFGRADTTSSFVVALLASPGLGDVRRHVIHRLSQVDEVERLLRLLALNDEDSVGRVLATAPDRDLLPSLNRKVDLLVRLGALLALGAATASLRATVDRAIAAGATEAEIADVLVAVAPAVGQARVVSTAPRLAVALGYDLEGDE